MQSSRWCYDAINWFTSTRNCMQTYFFFTWCCCFFDGWVGCRSFGWLLKKIKKIKLTIYYKALYFKNPTEIWGKASRSIVFNWRVKQRDYQREKGWVVFNKLKGNNRISSWRASKLWHWIPSFSFFCWLVGKAEERRQVGVSALCAGSLCIWSCS